MNYSFQLNFVFLLRFFVDLNSLILRLNVFLLQDISRLLILLINENAHFLKIVYFILGYLCHMFLLIEITFFQSRSFLNRYILQKELQMEYYQFINLIKID